jgi:hypothetical protein
MNSLLANVSVRQLKKAITIREKIESLEHKLNILLGSLAGDSTPSVRRGRRKVSAAGRARMAAAQKVRWARLKGKGAAKKGRRKMSASGRARIAAAARARWAKAKAAGKTRL